VSVGSSPPRLDGAAKVLGSVRYIDDLVLPDMLHGAIVRSTLPRARYGGYELDPGFDWSDVVIATAADVPGPNHVALFLEDQPSLVEDEIRHIAEPVLVLAAPTREKVLEARRRIRLLEEPLPAVFDVEASRAGAGPIWGEDNIQSHLEIDKGDGSGCVDKALAEHPDAILVEGRYQTGWQEQMYIETQGVIASPWGDGGVEVRGSLQCPYFVVRALKVLLGLPEDKVRVVQEMTGGGFGGKEEYPSILCCNAAVIALKAGRPVKVIYDRVEDMNSTTRRHPSIVTHRTAVAPDGELLAIEVDILFDGGAYATLSSVVLARGMIHAVGPYRCENVSVRGDVAATNHAPNGAFRGFGAPQVCFATERQMDRIAERLRRDPVDLRRQLALRLGDTTLTSQTLKESVASDEVLDQVLDASDYLRRRVEAEAINAAGGAPPVRTTPGGGDTPRLRGVGLSFFFHGAGFTGNGEARIKGQVRAELKRDGRVVLYAGSTEMGQGPRTTLPLIAADTLGMDLDQIDWTMPDTSVVPDSGPTVASRTCMVVGRVVEDCAVELRERVLGGGEGPVPRDEWLAAVGRYLDGGGEPSVQLTYRTPDYVEWDNDKLRGDAYPCYAWGADVVEVEVDPDTMEVGVVGFWTAMDVGRAIHRNIVEGQIEGGSLQSLGFGTVEQMQFREGRLLNDRMTSYIIPTALDAPEMGVRVVEEAFEGGPFGAKGIGEMPMDGGAPALVSAVEHATGVRLTSLPASPEVLLAARRAGGER
jgi:CO/xanthine dehydrogenase Mo-binding subunit